MEKLYTLGTLLCAAILVAMLCFVRGVRAETTPVCANPQDVYEMAAVYAMGGDIWGVKVSQGKCARISESVSYVRTMDKFPFRGQEMLIVQYATGTWPSGTLYGIIDKVPEEQVVEVTYKPAYGKLPPAVQDWFESRHIKGLCNEEGEAWRHLEICGCCNGADRLMTKFVHKDGHEWEYYPDPNCTVKGCKLKPIPDYIVHEERIESRIFKDDNLPEFQQMRREGVLFICNIYSCMGKPACFWPPEEGDY